MTARAIDADTLSEMAHRLRTPLAVISGYAELLQIRNDEETRTEAPARIQLAAARLTAAIDDVLELLAGLSEEPRVVAHSLPLAPDSGVAAGSVLLVDDDDELRDLLRATVPTDGFTLLEARDGAEALEALEHEAVDLVVLDWQLPARSGAEVLRELKLRQPDLPVIVLTADPRHRATAESLGAEVFLTKPFSPLELMGQIERLLS